MFVEPRDGDVVVVRASIAPDGRLTPLPDHRYAVIQWGTFQLVSEDLEFLAKDDAIFEARFCASERQRDAWDSTGKKMARLPRLPLVFRGVADTYAVSVDVTETEGPGGALAWRSTSHLSAAQAEAILLQNGVRPTVAKALIGKAPMPEACSGLTS